MIKAFLKITLLVLATCIATNLYSQKVGVVLSGGGASGLAHVGVLKALEENEIPIDCITGTSMGAIVGSMYAAGMSIAEMEAFFSSQTFMDGTAGKNVEQFGYFFKRKAEDASWINLKLDKDSLLNYSIPTNIIDPISLDLVMLDAFAPPSQAANYDFDSLFVPFRCIGADIVEKKEYVFREGELNTAVRVSSSYPFYFRPIRVEGKLLFDGGLYNNFPADLIYEDFLPDVIIGSNVSTNSPDPNEEDLFSLLENMIVSKTDFSLPCEDGIVILPPVTSGTFDFDQALNNIEIGYQETIRNIAAIREMIPITQSDELTKKKRAEFRAKFKSLNIESIEVDCENERMKNYVLNVIYPKAGKRVMHIDEIIPRIYRLIEDDKIQYIYPRLKYNDETGFFKMHLTVYLEKDFEVSFGGNFSSRPVNTGFIGIKYNLFGNNPKSLIAQSYFGKFYGSIMLKYRMDFPTRVPFNFEIEGLLNRYDYFESFATFFEDVKPSFIVQNEKFLGLNFNFPEGNKGKITTDIRYSELDDDYYQTDNFTSADTTDRTSFEHFSVGLRWERNTLNRKLFASEGGRFVLRGRYLNGEEKTVPGSTNEIEFESKNFHDWFMASAYLERYAKLSPSFCLGGIGNVTVSNQPFYANYTASLLAAPYFQPIPESKTLFQDEFRAHQFAAVGGKIIYNINDNLDIRTEHYMFQPFQSIERLPNDKPEYGNPFESRYYIGTAGMVFHSPVGPLSLNVNYFDQKDDPWSWIINFGYLIFNKRAMD